VHRDEDTVMLRCLNNCCGHVSRYSLSDLHPVLESQIVDHTTDILHYG